METQSSCKAPVLTYHAGMAKGLYPIDTVSRQTQASSKSLKLSLKNSSQAISKRKTLSIKGSQLTLDYAEITMSVKQIQNRVTIWTRDIIPADSSTRYPLLNNQMSTKDRSWNTTRILATQWACRLRLTISTVALHSNKESSYLTYTDKNLTLRIQQEHLTPTPIQREWFQKPNLKLRTTN